MRRRSGSALPHEHLRICPDGCVACAPIAWFPSPHHSTGRSKSACPDTPIVEIDPDQLSTAEKWDKANIVLVLEDSKGMQCLCPSRVRGGFTQSGSIWRFPGTDSRALQLDDPIGLHRAIAVLSRDAIPSGIQSELTSDDMIGNQSQLLPALDRLAVWLRYATAHVPTDSVAASFIPHVVRCFRFVLLPRRSAERRS